MDPFSGTTGAMIALGIASKLTIGGKQMYDFWSSVQDAPEGFKLIASDIQLLNMIFEGINESQNTDAARFSLTEYGHQARMLNDIVSDLEPRFSAAKYRTRKWVSVKAVLGRIRSARFRLQWPARKHH